MKALLPILAAAVLLVSQGAAGEKFPVSANAPARAVLPRASAAGTYQKRSLERFLAGAVTPATSLNVIVFRVSFADKDFAAGHDTLYFKNELRHVAEYYLGASRNIFHLKTTLYPLVVKLGGTEAYYGVDDLWKERMAELLIELVKKTDAAVDFSRYDAYALIHADAGQETDFNNDSKYQIASGFVDPQEMAAALKDTLGTPGVPTNDRVNGDTLYIDNLMVWPEVASQDGFTFGSLGIYAYQLGLRLGMVPLYDTTPEGFPDSQGLGNFDLMSYGIYNALGFVPAFPSAFNRYLLGWVNPVVVDKDASVRLVDINAPEASDTALVKVPLNPSEYFLIENRVHDTSFNGRFDFIDTDGDGIPGNPDTLRGAEFDFFLTATTDLRVSADSVVTGSGLMIYHVDESAIRRAVQSGGGIDDDKSWKGVDVEEADHIQDLDSPGGDFAFGSFYDSFRRGNNDNFGPDTDPSSADNAGVRTGVDIDEISSAAHAMTFRVRLSPPEDFKTGKFSGDIARLSPIAVQLPGSTGNHERLLLAADSASIYAADVGLGTWDGTVDKLPITDGGAWTSSPVYAKLFDTDRDALYLTSAGGILHGYDFVGGAMPIDDDGTPGTLKLHGDACSSPIVDPSGTRILVFSSTADSTYVMVLGDALAPSGAGWVRRGPIGFERGLTRGQIASHPAQGTISLNEHAWIQGDYLATYDADRGLSFNFIPVDTIWERKPTRTLGRTSIDPAGVMTREAGVLKKPGALLTIASGDVDGDGSDEMVATVDGEGLFYWKAEGAVRRVRPPGTRYSAPVLSDIDGDGALETAFRDESRCLLYSGFGVPARGWPRELAGGVAGHEDLVSVPAPVVGDVNGDGSREIAFLIAGDIHVFDFGGREVNGWPLAGEGSRGGSLTLLFGENGTLYVVDCASAMPYAANPGTAAVSGAISSIRRYDPGVVPASSSQFWRMYRHDAQGCARQDKGGGSPRAERIDPSTFIVYPNPAAGGHVTVRVVISAPAQVKVTFVNIEGQKVAAVERTHDWLQGSAVPFEQTFSTARLSGGVYVCHVEITGQGWSWEGSKKFAVIR